MKGGVLVHIGIHKTGTSLLQGELFTQTDFRKVPRRKISEAFIAGEKRTDMFVANLASNPKKNRILTLSHERLSGYPASGGYDRKNIAERLKSAFPQAKIFICIREQNSWINSFYQQYLYDGGSETLTDFLKDPQPNVNKVPRFSLDYLDYSELIGLYQGLFGENSVCVIPYEVLKNDIASFQEHLGEFLETTIEFDDVAVNIARPPSALIVTRFLNKYFYRSQLSPGGFAPMQQHHRIFPLYSKLFRGQYFNQKIIQRRKVTISSSTREYYRESNQKTQKLIDFDLKKLGYVL